MILIRFILRFLVVPLGGLVAAMIAVYVICFAHWTEFAKMVAANSQAPENIVIAVMISGPLVAWGMALAAFAMLTPAMLGALVSEIFALRSLLYHVTNGAVASAIGWKAMEAFLKSYKFFGDPMIVITAGIAAGFAYWAVAGWSAGFWKPVFAASPSVPTTTTPA